MNESSTLSGDYDPIVLVDAHDVALQGRDPVRRPTVRVRRDQRVELLGAIGCRVRERPRQVVRIALERLRELAAC